MECWLGDLSDYPGTSGDFDLPVPRAVIREHDAARLTRRLRTEIMQSCPDVVLLYGDLPVTLLAMGVVHGLGLPTVHIEAGHRSGDPGDAEELIRIAVSHGVRHRVAFSDAMAANLADEGIAAETVSRFGSPSLHTLAARLDASAARQARGTPSGLVTFHHDDNLTDRDRVLAWLCHLEFLSSDYSLTVILYRRTMAQLRYFGLLDRLTALESASSQVSLLKTLPYPEYVDALVGSSFVLTDSSTVQDECAFLRKPCVVVRAATPRVGELPNTTVLADGWPPERVRDFLSTRILLSDGALRPDLSRLGRAYDSAFVELLRDVTRR